MSEERPDPETLLRHVMEQERRARRGHLKVFLGYASRVGKTYRMLDEAQRRHRRGQDVVVGWVVRTPHDKLDPLLQGLELIEPLRGPDKTPGEMDVAAIVRRAPTICIVDELAHNNPPGALHPTRWQDVCQLLDAGIKVITAINVQYLDDLQDEVERLLGTRRSPTVPGSLIADADEVVLVDASQDDLIERGQGHPLEAPLLHLRELALRYAADTVEQQVEDYRQEHHIEQVWPTCERILVCLTAAEQADYLVERGYHTSSLLHGELHVVLASPDALWSHLEPEQRVQLQEVLARSRRLNAVVEVVVGALPRVLIDYARKHNITQLYVSHPKSALLHGLSPQRLLSGLSPQRLLRSLLAHADGIDVHVVADAPALAARGRGPEEQASVPSPPIDQGPATTTPASQSPTPRSPSSPTRLPPSSPPGSGGSPDTALQEAETRGKLKIYLGYAAGVGKTYQMLVDGNHLKERGHDVVIGYFEPHERADTMAQVRGLETVPRKQLHYRDKLFEEMDVAAVIARQPEYCLVDELAHTNIPGSLHDKRWEDVEELLEHGIHVWTTVNIQHLESLNDFVRRITHVQMRETIPDGLLTQATDVVLVDLTTRALLHRLQRGAVYPKPKAELALRNFFTEGNLNALRELALRQTADKSEWQREGQGLQPTAAPGPSPDRTAGETGPEPSEPHTPVGQPTALGRPPTRGQGPRDRVMVCLGAHPRGGALIRRAKRVADRLYAHCLVVHVAQTPGAALPSTVQQHFELAASLDLETRCLYGRDIASTLVDFAHQHGIGHVFLGQASPRSWVEAWRRPVVERVLLNARDLDVHIVADR
jgi:two-component system, OmpR family, sensor histidine kinase KdpD